MLPPPNMPLPLPIPGPGMPVLPNMPNMPRMVPPPATIPHSNRTQQPLVTSSTPTTAAVANPPPNAAPLLSAVGNDSEKVRTHKFFQCLRFKRSLRNIITYGSIIAGQPNNASAQTDWRRNGFIACWASSKYSSVERSDSKKRWQKMKTWFVCFCFGLFLKSESFLIIWLLRILDSGLTILAET